MLSQEGKQMSVWHIFSPTLYVWDSSWLNFLKKILKTAIITQPRHRLDAGHKESSMTGL